VWFTLVKATDFRNFEHVKGVFPSADYVAPFTVFDVGGNEPARLRAQAKLVEDYENRKWPRRAQSIPDLLAYLMEEHGLNRADLVPLLGTPSRVSEVLSGKSGLSMTMVRRLRQRFGVSADLLIPDNRPVAA
jgi:HTH-type transcriptional regulator/antitoxin HigA